MELGYTVQDGRTVARAVIFTVRRLYLSWIFFLILGFSNSFLRNTYRTFVVYEEVS